MRAPGGDARCAGGGPPRPARGPRRGGSARPGPGPAVRRWATDHPCGAMPGRGVAAGRRGACRAEDGLLAAPRASAAPGQARAQDAPARRGGRPRCAGPAPGRCARPDRRQPPCGDHRGSPCCGRVTSARTCLAARPTACTRWHPSPGTRSSRPARSSSPAAELTVPTSVCASPTSACAIRPRTWCAPSTGAKVVVDRRRAHRPAAGPRGRRGRGHRLGDPGARSTAGTSVRRRPAAAADGGGDHGARPRC